MFIETVPNRASPPAVLLRESYRDENGRTQKRTLANLSKLPGDVVAAQRSPAVSLSNWANRKQFQSESIRVATIGQRDVLAWPSLELETIRSDCKAYQCNPTINPI